MTDEIKEDSQEEAPKPPSVPLFNIPNAVLNSMSKEVAPDTSQLNNPVEWIMKQRKMAEAQVSGVKEGPEMPPQIVPTIAVPTPPQKRSNVPIVAWAGQDVNEDTLTMLFYLVVKEVSKDKKIKKMLKDMKVEVYDSNGDLLWP